MAPVSAIKDFYPYLYGHSFTLITGHNPLTSLKNLNDFGGCLTRSSFFLHFDFQFQYKQGTTHSVEMRFYWPGYETNIVQWVLNCQECQQRNPQAIKPQPPLRTVQASYLFELLSWDIMRPLPTNEKGNGYILVVTDIFTKWVEAFPLQNTLSTTLPTVLVDEVICRYSVPS